MSRPCGVIQGAMDGVIMGPSCAEGDLRPARCVSDGIAYPSYGVSRAGWRVRRRGDIGHAGVVRQGGITGTPWRFPASFPPGDLLRIPA